MSDPEPMVNARDGTAMWVIRPSGHTGPDSLFWLPPAVFRVLEPREEFGGVLFRSRDEAVMAYEAAVKSVNAADTGGDL